MAAIDILLLPLLGITILLAYRGFRTLRGGRGCCSVQMLVIIGGLFALTVLASAGSALFGL